MVTCRERAAAATFPARSTQMMADLSRGTEKGCQCLKLAATRCVSASLPDGSYFLDARRCVYRGQDGACGTDAAGADIHRISDVNSGISPRFLFQHLRSIRVCRSRRELKGGRTCTVI